LDIGALRLEGGLIGSRWFAFILFFKEQKIQRKRKAVVIFF